MRSWKVAALVLSGIALAALLGTVVTLRAQQGPGRVVVAPNVQVLLQEGPQIGVTIREVAPDEAAKLKLPSAEGAVVDEVRKDSPAEKAGIKAGDVIVEFDGQKVRGVRQLTRVVRETPAGRPVKVAVLRDGRRMELNVAPEERSSGLIDEGRMRDLQGRLQNLERNFRFELAPEGRLNQLPPELPPGTWLRGWSLGGGRLGITVEDLTEQLASYFGAKDGVLVRSVNDNSPAAKAGIKAGDVITSFNGEAVTSASGFSRMARNAKDGEEVTLGILRDHKTMSLKVKPEGAPPRRRALTPVVPA
jgi:serine protease Do